VVEQTDVSFRWPLSTNLSALGRWNHSLRDDDLLEAVAGVEYNSCCWALRAVARRYLTNTDGDLDNAFFFQVVLKTTSKRSAVSGNGGVGKDWPPTSDLDLCARRKSRLVPG